MPKRIIGKIPGADSTKLYQIQVGAFYVQKNAENIFSKLYAEGFTPVYERYRNYTRVIVTGIPASQIPGYLSRIKKAGFDEVIIREAGDDSRDLSLKLDLFCRTWRITDCTDRQYIGGQFTFFADGTYTFTTPDGELKELSMWRWTDTKYEKFEYSHDEWQHTGNVKIRDISLNHCKIFDAGFLRIIPGHVSSYLNVHIELVPVPD